MDTANLNSKHHNTDLGINELQILNDPASELINSEAFGKLLESLPDIIIIYRNGGILYINPSGAEILGGIKKHFINKTPHRSGVQNINRQLNK